MRYPLAASFADIVPSRHPAHPDWGAAQASVALLRFSGS